MSPEDYRNFYRDYLNRQSFQVYNPSNCSLSVFSVSRHSYSRNQLTFAVVNLSDFSPIRKVSSLPLSAFRSMDEVKCEKKESVIEEKSWRSVASSSVFNVCGEKLRRNTTHRERISEEKRTASESLGYNSLSLGYSSLQPLSFCSSYFEETSHSVVSESKSSSSSVLDTTSSQGDFSGMLIDFLRGKRGMPELPFFSYFDKEPHSSCSEFKPAVVIENLQKELKKTITAAKNAWIQNEPEKAKLLLSNQRKKIISEIVYWNPYDLLELQVFFCELEGLFEEGLRLLEETRTMRPGKSTFMEVLPERIYRWHLEFQSSVIKPLDPPRSDYLKEHNKVIDEARSKVEKIKLLVNLAKLTHFSSQFEIRDKCFKSIEENIKIDKDLSFIFSELENLAVEIGDLSFLIHLDAVCRGEKEVFLRKEFAKRNLKEKLPQNFVSLLYEEGVGDAFYERIKGNYQSLLSIDTEINIDKYFQYFSFLIRSGNIDETRQAIQDLLASEFFIDKTNKKKNQSYQKLMLMFIDILISSGREIEAFEKLEEFTQSDSKLAIFFIVKAFLYSNPLSKFYDITKAEKISKDIRERDIFKNSSDLSLLEYRIAAVNQRDTTPYERALQLMFKDYLTGSIRILMHGYPSSMPIHKKHENMMRLIKENHGSAFVQICHRRENGSLEDAYALGQELCHEMNSLALYQEFISPTGICYGNISEKIKTFTPSQKICALFEM